MTSEIGPAPGSPVALEVGAAVPIILDGVAHGGYAVGRVEGQVVFVRGAIPSERVVARITRRGRRGRFWFADVAEVLEAARERVEHPWPVAAVVAQARERAVEKADSAAEPEPVGGLDLGHVSLAGARAWKGAVIDDLFRRVAQIEWPAVAV